MSIEMVQTIGTHILMPIVILAALYLICKL